MFIHHSDVAPMTLFQDYRLPDGRVVQIDYTVARDARTIEFGIAQGQTVTAIQVSGSRAHPYRSDNAHVCNVSCIAG